MKVTITKHKWGSPQYLILNGRLKKSLKFPSKARSLVRNALARIGWRYKEYVPFWNPIATGFHNDQQGAIQWLEFAVFVPNVGMVALLFSGLWPSGSGLKEHEKRLQAQKIAFLEQHGTPYVLLSRSGTSQEHEIYIRRMKSRKA